MPGVPTDEPFLFVLAGFCLTPVYFAVGFGASGFGFCLGSVAAVVFALCVPALSVASALDEHAVE
jgi:hypothetical protein